MLLSGHAEWRSHALARPRRTAQQQQQQQQQHAWAGQVMCQRDWVSVPRGGRQFDWAAGCMSEGGDDASEGRSDALSAAKRQRVD